MSAKPCDRCKVVRPDTSVGVGARLCTRCWQEVGALNLLVTGDDAISSAARAAEKPPEPRAFEPGFAQVVRDAADAAVAEKPETDT